MSILVSTPLLLDSDKSSFGQETISGGSVDGSAGPYYLTLDSNELDQ